MAELATLVSQMESGDLPLEASLTAYQRGSELIRYCAAQLEKVEQQVKMLDAGLLKAFQPNTDNRADDDTDAASNGIDA